MNLTKTTSLGDYLNDLALAHQEREDAIAEAKDAYINRRADELHQKRIDKMSAEDFALAMERLTAIEGMLPVLQQKVEDGDSFLAFYLQGALKAALYYPCLEQALEEAKALFSEPVSRERH